MQVENVQSLQMLKKEVARILQVEAVDVTIPLAELGVDSINIVELMMYCEQLYGGIDPNSLEIDAFTTLSTLDRKLSEQKMNIDEAVGALG